jgi:hypothetical protein
VFDAVEKHYGIKIEYTFPDAQETMDLVREKGMFSFYEDGHQECCRVRKVRQHFILTALRHPHVSKLLVYTVGNLHLVCRCGRCGDS